NSTAGEDLNLMSVATTGGRVPLHHSNEGTALSWPSPYSEKLLVQSLAGTATMASLTSLRFHASLRAALVALASTASGRQLEGLVPPQGAVAPLPDADGKTGMPLLVRFEAELASVP